MTKPKSPLLSLGARGTIADSLTFQKRGNRNATIARQKPIPRDPKSEAQLAQRQNYRDAVNAWHALTPQEKESWRGVCRGLTAYQCFIRFELRKVVPPPEEYTEEQPSTYTTQGLYADAFFRAGQRLTIPNRKVTKLGFWLNKLGAPTGDVYFRIRRQSDDVVLLEKAWGDASALATTITYYEVVFDTPTIIDTPVFLLVEYNSGSPSNEVEYWFQPEDVKPAEHLVTRDSPYYTYKTAWDGAYRYKYYLP